MGYTLRIGELSVEYVNDEGEPRINLSALPIRRDDAPAFGEPTDYENQRWPSYSGWSEFAEDFGLYSLFFGVEGPGSRGSQDRVRDDALIANHPGCVPLTERHRREINDALARWKEKHPDARPTFGRPPPEGTHPFMWEDTDNPIENGKMTRMVWLAYWVNWAMDNCERPVFENT